MWYGLRAGEDAAAWHVLPSSVSGNRLQFVMGSEDSSNSALEAGIIAVAVPRPGIGIGNYQDLWWGGIDQSGWGVGIAQHRDQLFVTMFGYDPAGAPRWWVVTGGTWSADRRTFTGAVYQPTRLWGRQPPFQIGAPLGNVSLEFTDGSHAVLRYEMGGVSGERPIERQPLGAPGPAVNANRADMWWYADANRYGEGVFVAQQAATIFAVRYGYDDLNGLTHWDFLPGGMWTSRTRFVSGLYEAKGTDWLRAYDAAALQVNRVREGILTFEYQPWAHPGGSAMLDFGCDVSAGSVECFQDTIVPQPF